MTELMSVQVCCKYTYWLCRNIMALY